MYIGNAKAARAYLAKNITHVTICMIKKKKRRDSATKNQNTSKTVITNAPFLPGERGCPSMKGATCLNGNVTHHAASFGLPNPSTFICYFVFCFKCLQQPSPPQTSAANKDYYNTK